ncbi:MULTISPECIES: helix-turn-helix transcriptional regulator [unclassified Paenibacillus]|uniref:helix-turn-helix domain-containing protein n=1 Tax=unclassified Paenibacillus TaxID=185978 RepID=UPI000970F04C|nr:MULTISPECIES: helix-turn-helix transcriptional regulator [unclassified Paenibacillus]ASS66358.1 helix-turn-helix transcriptional regulator [Paenibacillus sp. RUD330]
MTLEIVKCRLQSIRRAEGITQIELCQLLDSKFGIKVKQSFISNLENNRGAPANHLMLKALSLIFERDMGDFYVYKW